MPYLLPVLGFLGCTLKKAAIGEIFFESRLMYIRNSLIYSFGKPQILLTGFLRQPCTLGKIGLGASWSRGKAPQVPFPEGRSHTKLQSEGNK